MTKFIVEIDSEADATAIEAVLDKMGLKYHIEEEDDEDDWGDLSEDAIEGIKAGLADIEAGRTYSHEEVMARIQKKFDDLK